MIPTREQIEEAKSVIENWQDIGLTIPVNKERDEALKIALACLDALISVGEVFKTDSPYPEDIFPRISNDDLVKINILLKKELGFPIDRLSGEIGRRVFDTTRSEDIAILAKRMMGLNDLLFTLLTPYMRDSEREAIATAILEHLRGKR